MTNNAKPNGFETDIDKATDVFLSQLSPEEEQVEEVEEESVDAEELNTESEDEIIEDNETEEEVEDDEAEEEELDDQVESEEDTEPQVFAVKVNGEELEVTEDELIKGYSRNRDYTRKTQELAREKADFQSTKESIEAEREELKMLLPRVKTVLEQGLGQEPDWNTLKETDQVTYLTEKANWDEHKARIQAVQNEMDKANKESQEESYRQMTAQIEEGRKALAEAVPEWTDEKIAAEDRAEMLKNAERLGFTKDEIGAVTDYRIILLLREAMLHNKQAETIKKKPTVAKARRKVARAGSTNSARPTTKLKKTREQVAKTGKVSDAAKFFEQII